jgi:hypothetical protein
VSKFGKFLSVFDFVVKAVLPGTLTLAGVPQEQVSAITHLAGEAEQALGPGTGPEKLQHVINGIADGMKAKGADDVTIAQVQGIAVTGINTAFDIAKQVKTLHDAHVDSPSQN